MDSTTLPSRNFNSTDILIGSKNPFPPSVYFNGKIDDIKIYDCALDAADVQQLYTSVKEKYVPQAQVKLYPNPMVTEAVIELPFGNQEVTLTLYDVMGRRQGVSYILNNNELTIQRGNLPGGIYFFAVTNGTQTYTGKLAVR